MSLVATVIRPAAKPIASAVTDNVFVSSSDSVSPATFKANSAAGPALQLFNKSGNAFPSLQVLNLGLALGPGSGAIDTPVAERLAAGSLGMKSGLNINSMPQGVAPLTVTGVQPVSVAGSGVAAQGTNITGGKGGNTAGTSGQTAGAGGVITLTAGAGGDAPSGSTNGAGGSITIAPGAAGGGAGTAGAIGDVIITRGRLMINPKGTSRPVASSMLWFNVLDYGADPTGVLSSSAAIQAAVTDATNAGGGTVFIPKGIYLITVTITLPLNVAIRIQGGGAGGVAALKGGTILKRQAGYTGSVISCIGSGSATTTFGWIHLADFTVDGTSVAGAAPAINMDHTTGSFYERVYVHSCEGTTAWRMSVQWNNRLYGCRVTGSGSGTATPAMIITGGSVAVENTNTLDLISCEWENNLGISCLITGDSAGERSAAVHIIGGKAENNVGSAGSHPMFRFERSQSGLITDMFLIMNGGAVSGPCIDQVVATDTNRVISNDFGGNATNNYLLDVQSGHMVVADNYFSNFSSTGAIRIGSGAGKILGLDTNDFFYHDQKVITDNRTGNRLLSGGVVQDWVGTGAPSLAAPVGSTYRDLTGSGTPKLYYKATGGTTSSGWVAQT